MADEYVENQKVSWKGKEGIIIRTSVMGLSKSKSLMVKFNNNSRKIFFGHQYNELVTL
jgi:hypothetical protein